jgi:hypothetical protein
MMIGVDIDFLKKYMKLADFPKFVHITKSLRSQLSK